MRRAATLPTRREKVGSLVAKGVECLHRFSFKRALANITSKTPLLQSLRSSVGFFLFSGQRMSSSIHSPAVCYLLSLFFVCFVCVFLLFVANGECRKTNYRYIQNVIYIKICLKTSVAGLAW